MKHKVDIWNFSIVNAANGEVDIHIDGQIVDASDQSWHEYFGDETTTSFKSFRTQVQKAEASTYNVYVNSPGGHVGDAMAIHDLLQDMQRKGKTVNTIGRGIIASAATYILMAGNSEMSENSWFMIHNVSGGVYGDVTYVESYARTLRKFNDSARDFYASKTGKRKEDITKMMNDETWMTGKEAVEQGFVKNLAGSVDFTNSIKADDWIYKNTNVLNIYNSAVKKPPVQDNSIIATIKNEFSDMKKIFTDLFTNKVKDFKPTENATPAEVVNQFSEMLKPAMLEFETEVANAISGQEEAITKKVTDALTDSITNTVTTSVTAAFEDRIKKLEDTREELELEITDKLGAPTTVKNAAGEEVEVIGVGHR